MGGGGAGGGGGAAVGGGGLGSTHRLKTLIVTAVHKAFQMHAQSALLGFKPLKRAWECCKELGAVDSRLIIYAFLKIKQFI